VFAWFFGVKIPHSSSSLLTGNLAHILAKNVHINKYQCLIFIFDFARLYVSSGRPQFSMDWTRFGVWPPYNLRMVTSGLFLQRNHATPSTVGSVWMPHIETAAAAIILGHRMARCCCGWACVHATTTAVVFQTRHAWAGCGVHVL